MIKSLDELFKFLGKLFDLVFGLVKRKFLQGKRSLRKHRNGLLRVEEFGTIWHRFNETLRLYAITSSNSSIIAFIVASFCFISTVKAFTFHNIYINEQVQVFVRTRCWSP